MLRDYAREDPARLYFIMGSDSMADLASWRDPGGILAQCTLVVFERRGFPARLPVLGPAAVVVFEEPVIDVASTEIRARMRRGESVAQLVSPAVLSYIERHRLYR
jgi:nicotinate-nucleotide adenylyltransferase